MYLLMTYLSGITVEAIMLHKSKGRLRVAIAGFSDAVELRRSGQRWLAEGHPVELEFLQSLEGGQGGAAHKQPDRTALPAAV